MKIIKTGIKSQLIDCVIDAMVEQGVDGKFYMIVSTDKLEGPQFYQLPSAGTWAEAVHLTECTLYLMCATYEYCLLGKYGPPPKPEMQYLEGEMLKYVAHLRQFKGFLKAEANDKIRINNGY